MRSRILTFAVTGMMLAALAVQAQEIQQRKENQQDRIANGRVANGFRSHRMKLRTWNIRKPL